MFDDFYGFRARPFQLTPDPAFYYESLTHRKALSYLGFGLAQGEGFIVITGEVGAGKSTLVAHLMGTIDRARLTAAQVVTTKLDGEELVHVVAQAFGLAVSGHDKARALGAIELFLHEEARNGRRCLLVVDESQNLGIDALEELRMLSNFQLGSQPLLQILLLGQPEFRENLQGHPQLEQLRQRVIAAHHLDPMEAQEVEPYMLHRLKLVGWNGNPAFDQRVFGELFIASGGVPRRINQIVNRLLILGAVDQRHRIDGVMLAQVLAELTQDGALHVPKLPDQGEGARPSYYPAGIGQASSGLAGVGLAASNANGTGQNNAPLQFAKLAQSGGHDFGQMDDALAQRDAQIAELQQAVIELANSTEHAGGPVDPSHHAALAALQERLATLESRLIEQDRTIRHTLTMLIEWIERDEAQRVAA